MINTLKNFDIAGERSEVNTGVWVGKNKISAIGVTASRWVTMHGIALNICCDLTNFGRIIPCGIAISDRGVCSLETQMKTIDRDGISMELVGNSWLAAFADVFSFDDLIVYDSPSPTSYPSPTNFNTPAPTTTPAPTPALTPAPAVARTITFPTIADLEKLYPVFAAGLTEQHVTIEE